MTSSAWNNPEGQAQARRQFTSADSAIAKHFDDIWDTICYLGCGDDDTFTLADVVARLAQKKGLTQRTAYNYVMAFMAYARAAPQDFGGPKSKIVRVSRGTYRLDDNDER